MHHDRAEATVGRQRELAMVREAVTAVARGESTTFLIEGEAGIGKSELVAHVSQDACDVGVCVMSGAAHPLEGNRPFGVIADALDLRPRSADARRARIGRLLLGGSEASKGSAPLDARFRVVDEILGLIEAVCAEAPLVMILEDIHWADESSLAAIGAVVHELAHAPLLLAATVRPAPRSAALDVLLDVSVASGARLLPLHPLSPDDVESLVTAQLGAPAGSLLSSIVARAGGNPLWIVELLRSLSAEGWLRKDADVVDAAADELPTTLRDLVLRRLRYLPSGALEMLQLTAVLGDSVSVEDLACVSARSRREVITHLSEAFRARLLDEGDDAVVFRHQLVQQAIYEDLPMPVRRALHRDAAGILARSGAELSKVASHLLRGADRGDLEAVRWLRHAANEAAAGSPSVAVELIRCAGELLPEGHHDADLVTAELAAALLRAGQVAEAADVAGAVLDRPHRDEADVPLHLTLTDALSLQDRASELMARAEAALAAPTLLPADRALVLTQASYGQTFSGDLLGGEATARRARELAEQAGSIAMTVWSLCAGSVAVKTQGRYGEALSMTRRAVALAFEPVDHDARLRHPHFFLGMALADADQLDDASRAYGQAIEEAQELGSGWLLPDMLALAAEARFLVGDWGDAWPELEAAVVLAQRHGQRISIPQARAYQAIMAAARGDLLSARGVLSEVDPALRDPHPPYGTEVVALAAATIAEAETDHASAFDLLLRSWNHDAEREIRYYHRWLGPPLVRLGLTLGNGTIAEEVAAAVEATAALAPEVPTVQSAALRCRGLLQHDAESLLAAVDLARRSGRPLDLAATCEDAASVVVATGEDGRAKDLLWEAQRLYEQVDATAWAARVAAALRGLGVRQGARGRRRRADRGWDSLTASERTVSELVAQGLTNREVARRVHISPHTVNTHLRHVFQKLAVTTRSELAANLSRQRNITHSSDVSPTPDQAR